MRWLALLLVAIGSASLADAQPPAGDSVDALVQKLASPNFHERQAATVALCARPEAAVALREALKSPDSEVRKRAQQILDYFDREPVRRLDAAIKEGRIDRVISSFTTWPLGNFEEDGWSALRDLVKGMDDLHARKGGRRLHLVGRLGDLLPPVVTGKRITESTKAPFDQRSYFVRAGEIDIDGRRRSGDELPIRYEDSLAIIASGAVRIRGGNLRVILAGGNVELDGTDITQCLIISGGDILLKTQDFAGAIVIARRNVKVASECRFSHSRMIAGKAVAHSSKAVTNIITENEPNPLGFIRWEETPKDKAK
ncbi:MAG: hypothetical protein HYR84_04630 [Planctomycetes bacterium]|nr:hypothetical protein [Planctomycetota bacterium]